MRPLSTLHPRATDLVLLMARVLLGVVFIAHGWQKIGQNGLTATQQAFAGMGAPLPDVSAVVAAVVELVGGALLVTGLLTPLAGILLALNMLGAYLIVHAGASVFVTDGGWELVGVLGVASLVLAVTGPGRFSVDGLVRGRGRGEGRGSAEPSPA